MMTLNNKAFVYQCSEIRCTTFIIPASEFIYNLQVWLLCRAHIDFRDFRDFRHVFQDGSDSIGLWPLLRLIVTEAFAGFWEILYST